MRSVLVIAFVLASSIASAADPPIVAVDITGLADGDYVIRKAGGMVTVRPLQLIAPGVLPSPIPPTPSPVTNDRAKAFQALVAAIPAANRADGPAVAELYRQLAKAARNGQIGDQATLATATKAATDLLLSGAKAPPWQPVRNKLSEEWTKSVQSGASYASYAELLEDAAAGIDAASPKQIDPAMLALILEIVKIILALFKPV